MKASPEIKVVVMCLSEDNDQDVEVVKLLMKALIVRCVDPRTQTQHLRFAPYDPTHRASVKANAWESTSPRDQARITELNKYLARLVAAAAPFTLVVHHFDADQPWDPDRPCPRLARWRKVVHAAVSRLAADRAARLVPLVPHPEIEAWLYLNRAVLRDLAERDGQPAPEAPDRGWDALPGVKDEHPWPRDRHNVALARSFPAATAAKQSPSLTAALDRIAEVPGLLAALAETRGEA